MSSPYGQQPYGQYGTNMPQMPMPNQYGQGYYQPPPPQQGYYGQPVVQDQKIDIKPNNSSDFKKSKIEFNEKPKFQDLWATLLHFCTVAITIVIAYVSIKNMNLDNLKNAPPSGKSTKTNKYSSSSSSSSNNYYYKRSKNGTTSIDIITMLGTAFGAAAIFTFVYMILIQRFAGKMIKGTFILSIILNIIFAVISFLANPIIGVIMLIFAGLYVLCYFFWKDRIPFAKVMLKTVTSVTRKFPATIFVGFLGCVVAAVWYGFISFTIIAALSYWQYENPKIAYAIYVFLLFSFYFTSQVINNTVHVTISGVFATYYFRGVVEPGTNKIEVDVKNPTIKSFNRAITTSFGSICFGSLLIALVNTLRVLARQVKNEAADEQDYLLCVLACCVECILSCLEDGIEYFNVYAFTEVAIYGKSYCDAAKDTWTLCKARGIEALINDNLIGNVLSIGALAIGCLSTAVTCAIGVIVLGIEEIIVIVIFGLVAFLVGAMIFSVVAQVINSGVATTFVCLCEDPDALRQTKPELWEKVRDTYPSIVY
jgi:hypothetical protein